MALCRKARLVLSALCHHKIDENNWTKKKIYRYSRRDVAKSNAKAELNVHYRTCTHTQGDSTQRYTVVNWLYSVNDKRKFEKFVFLASQQVIAKSEMSKVNYNFYLESCWMNMQLATADSGHQRLLRHSAHTHKPDRIEEKRILLDRLV